MPWKFLALSIALLTATSSLASESLTVWNIGQGQWTTYATGTACWHFDMGGEKAPWPAILKECQAKENFAYFSHWDQDHLNFAAAAAKRLRHFCVAVDPQGPPPERKLQIFRQLAHCSKNQLPKWPALREVYDGLRRTQKQRQSNDYSRVFLLKERFLIPGDSTRKEEKFWVRNLGKKKAREKIRVLVLGHHGSRTSTSKTLLTGLPGLNMAVASARQKKYGHPHPEVAKHLQEHGVSLLRTEDWGHLHFLMRDTGDIPY